MLSLLRVKQRSRRSSSVLFISSSELAIHFRPSWSPPLSWLVQGPSYMATRVDKRGEGESQGGHGSPHMTFEPGTALQP